MKMILSQSTDEIYNFFEIDMFKVVKSSAPTIIYKKFQKQMSKVSISETQHKLLYCIFVAFSFSFSSFY